MSDRLPAPTRRPVVVRVRLLESEREPIREPRWPSSPLVVALAVLALLALFPVAALLGWWM